MTIALVEDYRLFRHGIVSLINTFPEYRILFETGNGDEFCQRIYQKEKPDIVLLDLNIPVMNGVYLAHWLRENHPEIRVIVLSMTDDAEIIMKMIKTGIKGYLLKDSDPLELKAALDAVSDDNVYFPAFVTRLMAEHLYKPSVDIKLNQREKEFLKHAGTELTYKEIAERMSVSLRTVDGYRDSLFVKLNVKNRVGLVLYAIKNRLVEL